ncbi:MAG TPA: hypothetical protein VGI61_02860 [Parafilimonas sp.]
MKLKKTFLFLFSVVIASTNSFSQTQADGIIGGYIDAIGGRDKLAQINSIYIEETAEVMGSSGDDTVTILNGKGYKMSMNFNGTPIVQSVTNTDGWLINPYMGMQTAGSMPRGQFLSLRDNIFIPNPLLNYSGNGYLVKFTGQDVVDEKSVYKIETTSKDSVITTYYIDSATHFLDQKIININGETTTAKYSDYQKTDFGNTMAFSEDLTTPQGYELTFKINKIAINTPVDASVFDMPKN